MCDEETSRRFLRSSSEQPQTSTATATPPPETATSSSGAATTTTTLVGAAKRKAPVSSLQKALNSLKEQEKGRSPRVHAQRKFAQGQGQGGSGTSTPTASPIKIPHLLRSGNGNNSAAASSSSSSYSNSDFGLADVHRRRHHSTIFEELRNKDNVNGISGEPLFLTRGQSLTVELGDTIVLPCRIQNLGEFLGILFTVTR